MHPLIDSLEEFNTEELERKIQELGKKFFQTNNPALQQQVIMILNMYKEELQKRQAKAMEDSYKKHKTDLDNLINIS